MTPTLADLTTPLTTDQVRTKIYEVLAALGVRTTGWMVGSVVRAIITAVAIVVAAFSELTAAIAAAGFLELSSGTWLTQVARYQYGTERQAATFATTTVTLTNSSGGEHVVAIGDLVVLNGYTGKTYRNTAAVTIPAEGSASVAVRAVEAGSASSADPGEINALEAELLGVTVTNPTAAVGTDEETDAALRARARLATGALSPNGPWDAYRYQALSATREDGSAVGITRVATSRDSEDGTVTVTLATASGPTPSEDVDLVDLRLQTTVVPLTVTLTSQSASLLALNITYTVWAFRATGITEEDLKSAIAAKLAEFAASVPIGGFVKDGETTGYVYADAIRGAIMAARDVGQIWHCEVTSGDYVITASQVVSIGSITPTINWVQQ